MIELVASETQSFVVNHQLPPRLDGTLTLAVVRGDPVASFLRARCHLDVPLRTMQLLESLAHLVRRASKRVGHLLD